MAPGSLSEKLLRAQPSEGGMGPNFVVVRAPVRAQILRVR